MVSRYQKAADLSRAINSAKRLGKRESGLARCAVLKKRCGMS